MRMTNNMMITNMMRNLNRNMIQLSKRQMQVSTGKRIHLPSDDPVAISRVLKIRADLSELEQFRKNVDDATSWLETTELAVHNIGEALHRLREIMVQGANGVLTQEETLKIKEEVKQIKDQIINLGNTTYSGQYIFSGKKTNEKLFDQEGNYLVDLRDYRDPSQVDDRINYEVGIQERIEINALGFDIFELTEEMPFVQSPDGEYKQVEKNKKAGLIQLIENIEKKLTEGDHAGVNHALGNVDKYMNSLLVARSEIGAKINRMELIQNRIADDYINFTKLRSQLEDADMGRVIMELMNEENVYRASLSVGAKVIQPTLLDFLR